MNLWQVVETAKRILTKEKIDRQLTGQTSSNPFMSIRDGYSKRVTFEATDDIEQKIDKLMTMMGNLVTEDEGQSKPFKPWVYQSNRVRNKIEVDIKVGVGLIMHIGDAQYLIWTLEVRWDIILIAEVIMVIMCEVIRGMWGTIVIEGMIIRIDFMIEIRVGHMKDRIEAGEIIEVWVGVGWD